MREVFVLGVGMTRFGKFLDRGMKDLAREAITAAIDDAGVSLDALECAFGGNAVAGLMTGQESIRAEVILRALGLSKIPIFNVENACASSSSALHLAALTIAAGQHDCVLVYGVEKLTHPDKRRAFDALAGALDVETVSDDAARHGVVLETGASRSVFMDYYAASARAYFERTGAGPQHLAWIASKNHTHGALNPFAQYRMAMSVEAILADVSVVPPLTRSMCSPIADGAAAMIIGSPALARRLGRERIRVAGTAVRSFRSEHAQSPESSAATRAAVAAYRQAGIGAEDADVFEVHDATAYAELQAYEEIGLCAAGEGARLVEERATTLGGSMPVNPSGGLECRGHPVGATGVAQVVELTWQLGGRAGERQVAGAPKVGVAHNAGGHFGDDNATCCVTVLSR